MNEWIIQRCRKMQFILFQVNYMFILKHKYIMKVGKLFVCLLFQIQEICYITCGMIMPAELCECVRQVLDKNLCWRLKHQLCIYSRKDLGNISVYNIPRLNDYIVLSLNKYNLQVWEWTESLLEENKWTMKNQFYFVQLKLWGQ